MKHLMIFKEFNLSESYRGQWDSSIEEHQVLDLCDKIYQVQKFLIESLEDDYDIYISKIESILQPYDKIVQNFLLELFTSDSSDKDDELVQDIIELGDKIINRYGTEPRQVLNAIEDIISYFSRFLTEEDILAEKFSLILEKNIPTNSSLWAACKAWAKSKYDVWPSAYAVGAAAKRYKAKGGKWKKKKSNKK
jgi:hypothetical protein